MAMNLAQVFPYVPRNLLAWWFRTVLPAVVKVDLQRCSCGQHYFVIFDITTADARVMPIVGGELTCRADGVAWLAVLPFLSKPVRVQARAALRAVQHLLLESADPEVKHAMTKARQDLFEDLKNAKVDQTLFLLILNQAVQQVVEARLDQALDLTMWSEASQPAEA